MVSRLLVSLLLLWLVAIKWWGDVPAHAHSIGGVTNAAKYISVLEVLILIGLWVRPLTNVACWALLVLSMAFLVRVVTSFVSGGGISCGCLGSLNISPWSQLALVGGMLFLALSMLWRTDTARV